MREFGSVKEGGCKRNVEYMHGPDGLSTAARYSLSSIVIPKSKSDNAEVLS